MLLFKMGLAYAALINLITFGVFAHDKRRARQSGRRVPEKRLLILAALGGWGGAKFAQQRLRHKSSKQPFGRQLNAIGVILVFGIACAGYIGIKFL
ncbi:putative membrane protein [Sulfitobacter donghicola DSW-25 = KCTC 12864 = JCM 14565]|uniref:Cold-shock protein n=2 Tax=Sulfitobacter TaxID=60136 RepID=A0A073IZI3_9RHOB|nr:cold-shock protein [Sulfitobacter donghicola DSW-25 = KCTC 12864 = JCM 14565]KIN68108.1 putative membrane protein [Sulfitobacter donghicola DSW-25 = KCTC 12864 = JCM 14565]